MGDHADYSSDCWSEDDWLDFRQPNYWISKDGKVTHPRYMETEHILNALRFLQVKAKESEWRDAWIRIFKAELKARK